MFRALVMSLLLAATPASANYTLKAYELGGGAGSGSSTNYALKGGAGGVNGKLASATYALPAGVQASRSAAVPAAPTLVNQSSSYNKLHLTLNNSGFTADVKFLIAISTDNFTTTNYIQLDNTVGSPVSISNYQLYTAWGGSSGFDIVGLTNGTTYKVKVAALHGSATGSSFGPTATAATLAPTATFALETSLTVTPPFGVAFTSLPAGAVTSGNATITGTVSTNASGGGNFVITDSNSGLNSPSKSFTLASATTDLSSANSGYGVRVSNTSQSSGAAMTSSSPFNGSTNNVGAISGTAQQFTTWNGPVTTGASTLSLLAKSSTLTPASSDYADVITISLSLVF
jgi:hypothetical protein